MACILNIAAESKKEIEVREVVKCFLEKEKKGVLLEMCCNPEPWTEVAVLGRIWDVILGTEAMLYQGLEQDVYWTGRRRGLRLWRC